MRYQPNAAWEEENSYFGFCNIGYFTKINIALEEKTMILVNEISEIVHYAVDKYGGATNKNMGDAFLNAWKFDYAEAHDPSSREKFQVLDVKPGNLSSKIADSSLFSFLLLQRRLMSAMLLTLTVGSRIDKAIRE